MTRVPKKPMHVLPEGRGAARGAAAPTSQDLDEDASMYVSKFDWDLSPFWLIFRKWVAEWGGWGDAAPTAAIMNEHGNIKVLSRF